MKLATTILIQFICITSMANECTSITEESVMDDWNKATEVFLGKVISARLTGETAYDQSIETTIKVVEILKGNPKDEFSIVIPSSYSPSDLAVGANSIFFLYGSYKLNSCNNTLYINPGVIDLSELIQYTNRADITYANAIKKILVLSGKMP